MGMGSNGVPGSTDAGPSLELYGMQQGAQEEEEDEACQTCGASFATSACRPGWPSQEGNVPSRCGKCTETHERSQKLRTRQQQAQEEAVEGGPEPARLGTEDEALVCQTCGATFVRRACEPGLSQEGDNMTRCNTCNRRRNAFRERAQRLWAQKRKAQEEAGGVKSEQPPPKEAATGSDFPFESLKKKLEAAHSGEVQLSFVCRACRKSLPLSAFGNKAQTRGLRPVGSDPMVGPKAATQQLCWTCAFNLRPTPPKKKKKTNKKQ